MNPDRSRLRYLLKKYADNTCTFEEFTECTGYFDQAGENETILEWMEEEWLTLTGKELGQAAWRHLYPAVGEGASVGEIIPSEEVPSESVPRIGGGAGWWKYAAAAVVILLIGGYYWFQHQRPAAGPKQEYAVERFRNDIPAPAGTHTILKLANGSQVILDSVQNGMITKQGNAEISKAGKDQLVYTSQGKRAAEIFYNTLSTARGGRTSLVLPDGSKVWLNALSSLRFPTTFTGKERVVELSGEAYFEIAKNADLPFQVKVINGMQVQVLGTSFNIMAYADEPVMKTTLLEGSVRLIKGPVNTLLKPGEQAKLDRKETVNLTAANVEEVLAWKNNLFWFDNTDMETIMRQVTRWYDVDIVFDKKLTKHFTGTIPKDASIATLFKVMELSGGVHFTIDGKRVGVSE